METKTSGKSFLLSISLLLGLTLLGVFIYKGLKTFSDKDRIVTVKGLAEMKITAISASITLSFSFSGDNLQDIIKQSEAKKELVLTYLINKGYNKTDIQIGNINFDDKQKYYEIQWQNGQQVKAKVDRYSTTQSLTIQSKDIQGTEDKAAQIKLDLVNKDLTSTATTNYSFPELNSIKPKLIAESTKNARVAGEQFANDSKATLGKIKTASQGQISIAGKYHYDEDTGGADSDAPKEPYIQKARVVSTIVFFLE
ncbi:MAG: SIMPL domain-containing protein [Bacteroidetes bacterium]|nr:SIMPL domain-containing protein [Bacteroidota bacterium]MBS1591393.1 SIMPL domain-containing protein [Bacteroidota bacterium]MBS1639862.1 SIMPL domain-containing protein [Bacteroidota bacterium]MBS1642649.1 SIMPL domain-containing protein [Bacteroidota bacterium]MBS1670164.1 SIMPL domain-containing protein [Bacteroidota bacterium]